MPKKNFTVNISQGKLRITPPFNTLFRLDNLRTRVWINNKSVQLFPKKRKSAKNYREKRATVFLFEEKSPQFSASLSITCPDGKRYCIMQMKLKNLSKNPLILGTLHLAEFPDVTSRAEGTKGMKVFVDSGGGDWAGTVDIESTAPCREQWKLLPEEEKRIILQKMGDATKPFPGFHNSFGGISALFSPCGNTSLIASFLTAYRTINNIVWLYDGEKRTLSGWASCNFAGFSLKSGEEISSEKLFIGFYDSPLEGLEEYAAVAGREMKVKNLPPVPLGWCSWYAYRLKITEKETLENAKCIKKRFPGFDFSYIQVDHGWQYKNICGHWTETNERFPHGIKWLSEKLKGMGYTPGLWLGLFTVLESAHVFREHPEYMIQDKNGCPLQMPYIWSWPPRNHVYYLDPTHPGARKFIKDSLLTLRKLGIRYWKIDFTWGIANNGPEAFYYDKNAVKGAETYRRGLSLVSETLKGDYIYWCSCPINLGFGLGATSTTGSDIGNTGFSREEYVEGRVENLDYFRQNATTIASRYFLHKKLMLLNPDVVETGEPGNIEEAKLRVSLVALSGGQIFLGDALPSLAEERWKLLSVCIPPFGKAARPVDLFTHTYPSSYPQIWHLPIETDWGKWEIAGLFNLTKVPSEIQVDFESLKLDRNKEYLVYEFWSKKFLGIYRNSLSIPMPPVTTKLLMIRELSAQPRVLSTDMHITQGAMELDSVIYDGKKQILRGNAVRQKGDTGNIVVFIPEGYRVKEASSLIKHTGNIAFVTLKFKKAKIDWHIEFIKEN
ncbi:MAG: alpha-galactosidase [Candidatus Omnitrophica bacterium]|nr:alpha-galactosidase [Candidatus Omnitrophota bacterium]